MSVEACLTRELGIRFIDARKLATEARIEEGIEGYPTKEECVRIVKRALDIFDEKSEEEKALLLKMNDDLESMKSSHHSKAGRKGDDLDDNSSQHSASSIGSNASETSLIQRVVSLSSLRRKKKDALAANGIGSKNATFNLASSTVGDSSFGNIRKATSMGGLKSGKQRPFVHPKANLVFEGLPPRANKDKTAASRVNHLGAILDIKVPAN